MTAERVLPAATVREIIATAMLGGLNAIPEQLGRIVLRPYQRTAAERLMSLIETNGGALLAEPVGLGKTYTALATAVGLGGEILIVAPAALREMWTQALEDCGASAPLVTHEALSRGTRPICSSDLVIVDEAHRVRSTSTKRYAVLADLCRRSRVLLVTATPVQNRRDDLAAQLALFLGRQAWEMDDEALAAHVVRGSVDDGPGMRGLPAQVGPHSLALKTDDDCLEEILALPPPVPAKDESVAAALLTYGLVHQWTSSRAALVAALRRRRTRGLALLAAFESGRRPTRAELAAWTHFDDAMQLAFPELVTAAPMDETLDVDALTIALDRHGAAIEALLRRCRAATDPDAERAALLQRVRSRHPDERIIAFCHYAETVNALRQHLVNERGVAALTARGACVAGGRVSRDTVLAQFLPRGERPDVSFAERIDLLLTTDLLSEGLNLQEASVVVHLDLPWNPARLDQRVGRMRRLGSRHDTVTVYTVAAPASAARLLRIEQRLRDKLRLAQRTIGVAGRILPSPLASCERDRGIAEQSGEVHRRLRAWAVSSAGPARTGAAPVFAAIESEVSGFLAVIHDGRETRLLADLGRGIVDGAEHLARAVELAEAADTAAADDRRESIVAQLERHIRARQADAAIDFRVAAAARSRREALSRVAQALARTPRHRRAHLAPLADAARAVATAPLGEGAERILAMLVKAELPDEAWLRSIATFGELNVRGGPPAQSRGQTTSRVVAVIAFERRRGFSPEQT